MATRILAVNPADGGNEAVREAGRALADGAIVVFPTETVYGVGANAADRRALETLSRLKSRAPDKPFTLHLARPAEASRYAGPLSTLARRLIRKCWPGPLTLVLPDGRDAAAPSPVALPQTVYWQGFVGLRCPDHAVGRAVLEAAGVPVVASSANLAGRPAPRTAGEALAALDGHAALVIDSGPAPYARPSTVVRIRPDDAYEILREGAITARRLERLARTRILIVCTGNLCRSPMAMGLARKIAAARLGCPPEELEDRGVEIRSAGTGAVEAAPASANAILAAGDLGVDLRNHTSRPMTVDALLAADYIWVMTRGHLASVVRLAPEVADRTALLDPRGEEIGDPMGGDLATYRQCARRLEAALVERLAEIT
jgi:protein-tyrosine phosphatase